MLGRVALATTFGTCPSGLILGFSHQLSQVNACRAGLQPSGTMWTGKPSVPGLDLSRETKDVDLCVISLDFKKLA